MEKLLIGAIAVLILLAFTPIKSTTFHVANMNPATTEINYETERTQSVLVQLNETNELNNSELTVAENEVIEINQETGDTDRVIFISIGSLLLVGFLLLLPIKST